ncbi:MAG: hypothetical protein H7X80_05465 [bacterium]|nr:hypothetical protein [Candidatus Kapabacteria bacterium]
MSRSDRAKLAALIIFFVGCAVPLCAQDLDEDFANEFPDEPLTYVGLGPGVTATFIFMDLAELNTLAKSFEVDEFGGPLTVYGGGVIFTPIFVPNIRLGFYAFGGYHRSSRPKMIDSVVYNRTLRFGIRFQGSAGVEYAIPVSGRFTMLPAVIAGWGSYALEFTQSTSNSVPFSQVWDPRNFDTNTVAVMSNYNRAVRMLNYHAFIYPTVHLEYAISGNLMVRGSVGYRYGLLDKEWTNESETVYENVPSITANGPTLQLAVFFGLFQQ